MSKQYVTTTHYSKSYETLLKILFLSFSKPRIVKLLTIIRVRLYKNTYSSNSLVNFNYHFAF